MLQPLRANDIRTAADLASHYRQYLRVLNQRTFDLLHLFVARSVKHNERNISLSGYSALIRPGTTFCPLDIVTDVSSRTVAARLQIEVPLTTTNGHQGQNGSSGCHSPGKSTGVQHISEFVFYRFDENWQICQVWSITDEHNKGSK